MQMDGSARLEVVRLMVLYVLNVDILNIAIRPWAIFDHLYYYVVVNSQG
jgi:hypothetical protein